MSMSRTLLSVLLPLNLIACATQGDPQSAADPQSATVDESSVEAQGFSHQLDLDPVASANPKTPGIAVPNALSPQLIATIVAQGSNALENPASVSLGNGTSIDLTHYGYNGNGPMVPAPGDVQSATHNVEAQKTEPDKNTYLVLRHQKGADPSYDYGTHFLFQGHENGSEMRPARGSGSSAASTSTPTICTG